MTPAKAIAMLDRQVAAHGQPGTLRRGSAAAHSIRCVVRGYRPEQLVGLVTQADRNVILSPSTLGAFGVPSAQDRFTSMDQIGTVQDVEPVHLDGVLVRVSMRVRIT